MPATPTRSTPKCRSHELLETLSGYERFLVVGHDNPDPDAIAAGWALRVLIEERLGKSVELLAGGGIVRAENRHMLELLNPPLRLVTSIELPTRTAVLLVDCDVGGTNQLLSRQGIFPVAVIDHHRYEHERVLVPFRDCRPEVVASASIAASYLREQNIEPGLKLATAMWYAMRTETRGEEFSYSSLDRSILLWLTERAEPTLLAEIESAPLGAEYYGDLVLAIQNTFVHGQTALCLLPRAAGAEIVGEVADLLIRYRRVHRVLCGAVVGEDLFVSVRTDSESDSAVALVQATLDGIGSGGGHAHRAGGKISGVGGDSPIKSDWQQDLRRRWLAACNVEGKQGRRLVAKREIINNL